MLVLMVAPSLREASARLRLRQYLPALAERGHGAELLELPARTVPRLPFFRSLARADVVVLHRKLLSALEFAILRRCCRRLVFDFDDAVQFRDPFRGPPESIRRDGRFARTVRGADAVLAGNAVLAGLARQAGAVGRIETLPTPVDVRRYAGRGRPPAEGFLLGWIGQASTLPYLLDVLPALEDLARGREGIRLRVIADAFPDSAVLPIERRPWSEDGEAELLEGVDAGLMPLRDDPWSRGKCGYKILQYFAARRPVVASPVGVNADLVRPGINGFHARSAAEWADAILRLRADPGLGEAMGREGRRTLTEGGYTLEACVPRLAAFLEEVA
ncbi:MAG: glycosyltransferase family 4 protein [Planctomycetes bacterium]|jgi:glycosyltransferase involved in cell wall biosynthesis|nr:glycosyltransferase family 4 protein [Planctomycetota bacterium]